MKVIVGDNEKISKLIAEEFIAQIKKNLTVFLALQQVHHL